MERMRFLLQLLRVSYRNCMKYICKSMEKIDLGEFYWIMDALQRKTDLQIGAVTRTDSFDQTFYYDGKLGVQYQPEETII